MRIRWKTLLSAFAALSLLCLRSMPVQADTKEAVFEDRVVQDFSFTRGGQTVTCTVIGFVRYTLSNTAHSSYYGTTEMRDTDPACQSAFLGASVDVRLSDKSGEHFTGSNAEALADYVFVGGYWSEAASQVHGFHSVAFRCDDPVTAECDALLVTAPK